MCSAHRQNNRVTNSKLRAFIFTTALAVIAYSPCKADVPAVVAAPAPPAGYCTSIYSELQNDLQAFNAQLATPPTWTPVAGGPTLFGANLAWADSNTGPSISNPSYLPSVIAQLQELKAMGIQSVEVSVGFPVLYEPFYGSQAALQPYLTFYTAVAQAVHAAGLKLIVDNEELFSDDIAAGWTNTNAFYSTLNWPQYMAARAAMAATVATTMQPDFMVLANEPDTEAAQTGQQNLNNPVYAAQMIAGEIAAVQALNLPSPPQLGAGFGTWLPPSGASSLAAYTASYIALPLNYIDMHLIPVNTVGNTSYIGNALTVASAAAAAGMPVAIGQAWLEKAEATELSTLGDDVIRARSPFSFWAPLDTYFLQTLQSLANYTQMLYMAPDEPFFFFTYQTYGGTTSNGGAANCTCTTASCSDYDIMQTENTLTTAANASAEFTSTAFSYYGQLVTAADVTPPSMPANLTGTAGETGSNISWAASTDDVGVAGYNVYRCVPPAVGQSCTGVWIANATTTTFVDSSLTSNTPYNYQVQAFDLANNVSPMSATLSLETFRTTADSVPSLVATAVSPKEIDLSWQPPSDTTGLNKYLVYGGTSATNLQQIVIMPSTVTTYKNLNLAAGSTYYYAIVAVEQGINSAMSLAASATTLPLPNPPSNITAVPATNRIALSWQESIQPGGLPVNMYQVYEGTTPGQLAKIATTTATSYTATPLTPNTTYYFEIVSVDTGFDDSVPSDQTPVTTLPMPASPVNVTATASSGTKVTITWSEVIPPNGLPIEYYYVFEGTSPSSLAKVATVTGTSYTASNLVAGTTYYFAIEALDTGMNVSPMSPPVQVTTLAPPAAPVNVTATSSSGVKATVTWSETIPQGGLPIQYYYVFEGASSTNLNKVATVTAASYNASGLVAGATYYFAVEAVDTGMDVSPMSAVAQVTTVSPPATPVNVTATASSSVKATVSWSENIPAGGLAIQYYYVFEGASASNLTKVATVTAASYTASGLTAGATYYFAVEAVDKGMDVSPMSATAQVTTLPAPAAPVNVTATAASSAKVTLTWSENIPQGGLAIKYYTIFRGTSPGSLTQLANSSATSYNDTAVSASTTYYYAIEATDTGLDVSAMSLSVQAATPAAPATPTNVTATANSATQVTVSFSETIPPAGLPIQYFYIYRGTSPTGLAKLTNRSASPFVDTTVAANTTYYYAIEAVDTGGAISPMSTTVVTPN
jgi:fibronectin type 3 domain-containing protein